MITNYRRARQDAAVLIEWAKTYRHSTYVERYLEAFGVMNRQDEINVLVLVLLSGEALPKLPDAVIESGLIPETGA